MSLVLIAGDGIRRKGELQLKVSGEKPVVTDFTLRLWVPLGKASGHVATI